VYKETLTGRPHDTSVQKATSDNENVDAVLRHAQDRQLLVIDFRNRSQAGVLTLPLNHLS